MKKCIVIAEILYPVGHKPIDKKIIEILSNNYSLIVLNYHGYFEEINSPSVRYIELPSQILIKKHEPFIQVGIRYNISVIKHAIKEIDYEDILFLSCNNGLLSFISKMFKDKRVFVMHHNDIDAMKTEKQIQIFRKGMNSVNHITVADFISEGLSKKTGCPKSRIYTVPHPITSRVLDYDQLSNRQRMIVGLGLSNDEDFINDCIELDRKLVDSLNYKIILRSTKQEYKGKSLTVIKGYLDDKTYNDYYLHAEAILICYPQHFQYRYSATLIFAVAQNGKVIFNDFPMGREESNKYPHIMKTIKSPDDLFTLDASSFGVPVNKEERIRFLEDHSDERVAEAFNYLFNN